MYHRNKTPTLIRATAVLGLMLGWRRLHVELDRWRRAGHRPRLWWRDDDACRISPELQRLAALAHKAGVPVCLGVIPALLPEQLKPVLGWFLEICMLATNLFMLWWGIKLVETTWYQGIAEFPIITAGMEYLLIPIGGALTALYVIERLLTQKFFSEPEPETVSQISTE